jgi:hypothetical protein
MFCIGYAISGGGCKAGAKYYKAISSILLSLPMFNTWVRKLNFTSIDKNNMKTIMEQGDNISMLPGGFNEMLLLRKPCLSLGENETFSTLSPPKFMWKYLFRMMKVIPVPLSIPYWIHRVPVVMLYGEPIECHPGDNIPEIRDKLIVTLTKLFEDNIENYCKYRNDLKIKPSVNVNDYSIHFYGEELLR